MNRTFDLIWLRIREYFHHPAEDIRQAQPIVPGRLYTNFGYICKAVPYSKEERMRLAEMPSEPQDVAVAACNQVLLEQAVGIGKKNPKHIRELQDADFLNDTQDQCIFCDFHRKTIPCPFYNTLADGSTVCDTHKYVILKNQR